MNNDEEEMGDEDMDKEDSEHEKTTQVVTLLPVHAANFTGHNKLKTQRERGRPRRVERMPTTSDLEYHSETLLQRASFIDDDPLVKAAKLGSDPMTMIHIICMEVAKEQAAIHFQRIENEKFGKDVAQIASRRIDALKKVADISLEIKKMGVDAIDVRSDKIKIIYTFWIDCIREVASDIMTPEQVDLFFNKLSTAMDGWEDKVADKLR